MAATTAAATIRRPKWHPPPQPTPRILHLPRRTTRRKPNKKPTSDHLRRGSPATKLEALFDQERAFSYSFPPVVLLNSRVRERVETHEEENENMLKEVVVDGGGDVEERENEEKWRFQAEILRAECNFLRMEKEIAVKKLEKERGVLEKSLKSAVHTLLSQGKKKIREGQNVDSVLEEEIEDLAKKLVQLQKSSKMKQTEHQTCSNFDKQASLLQKQLEKLGQVNTDESCVKDIQEMSGTSFSTDERSSRRRSRKFADVETLRRKMEGLSKGKLLKRMEEEYGSMLSATANCSMPTASTSRRYDLPELTSFAFRQSSQDAKSGEAKTCSGHCKAIVRRIMEQVRAETKQWSQMQEMLGQVRGEMEELQAARDFWEDRALESDYKIQSLNTEVEEWKQKALSFENKESQLHKQVQELQQELEKLRIDRREYSEVKASKSSSPISLGAQLAMEKRLLKSHLKGSSTTNENSDKKMVGCSDGKKALQRSGNRIASSNRTPFKEVGNIPPLVRHNSRRYVYPLHCPQEST